MKVKIIIYNGLAQYIISVKTTVFFNPGLGFLYKFAQKV